MSRTDNRKAITEAEEWLAKLRETEPVEHPADVTGGLTK